VRFVFHADAPESLDSYYQEFGRAGRDGAYAEAVLFRALSGGGRRRYFGGSVELSEEVIATVADAVRAVDGTTVDDLVDSLDLSAGRVRAAVDVLMIAGGVTVGDGVVQNLDDGPTAAAVADAIALAENRRVVARTRADMMEHYLETSACRWATILAYFGEPRDEPCGRCDNCERGDAVSEAEQPWPLGSRVRHGEWGDGDVVAYEDDTMTVLFDEGGYRTLSVGLVLEGDLLKSA
jgi:ATP-dependent DNA helicase RecQ